MHKKYNKQCFSRSTLFYGLLAAGILLGGQSGAYAAENSLALEEVMVTAQKRTESLQDVPVTVQAFSGDQLKSFGISQVSDITKLSPNLNIVAQNAMSQHIVIRGVGSNEFFGNGASSVGSYMDEVTMNSSYMSTLGLFDMERVEVLRGPQNSLFGRNTTGGAINYISYLPEVGEPVEGYVSAGYGSHNRIDTEGGVSFPLGETAAARIAAMTHNRDGRWNNITTGDDEYGDEDRYSIRGTLVWDLSADTTVTGSFHVARDRSEAQPQKAFGTLNNNGLLRLNDERTIFGPAYTSDIDFDQAVSEVTSQGIDVSTTNWEDIRTGGSQKADLDVDGGYLKLIHHFSDITFTGIVAYDKTHALYEEDNGVSGLNSGPGGDGLNQEALVIDMDQQYEQRSVELRFASSDDNARLRWIAGFYYFDQESTLAQSIRFGDNGVLAFHPAANGAPVGFDDIPNPFGNTAAFSIAELEDTSVSVYSHVDFDITQDLTLTVGLRYTEDTLTNPSYYGGSLDITGVPQDTYYDEGLLRSLASTVPECVPIDFVTVFPFTIGCATDDTSREDIESNEVGGKIGLDYHFNDDLMVYASYSHGFKSGKFDVEFLHTAATPFPQRSLDVETLDVFELGFKSELLDGRMQINGAVFHNIWENQQVFNVGSNGPEFFNLPESQITGLEIEARFVPAESWLVSVGLGLLDSEMTDTSGIDFDSGEGEFQNGHELPLTPDLTANFAIYKDITVGDNELTLQFDGRYQSTSKVKYKPSYPIDEYKSRFEMNLRANLVFGATDQYEVSASLENLTEEQYCLEKQDLHALVGAYYCVPNDGERQFMLTGQLNF
ncbi:MAG: TonB-dependent receptor [Spongiibacteraceae bacterium]|nr:TonB-dependent receptor [Spongiibacteraceae bacterium]